MTLRMKNMFDLGPEEIEKLLDTAESFLKRSINLPDIIKPFELIGTLFHNAPVRESNVAEAVAARMKSACVHFNWKEEFSYSHEELIREVSDVSSAVDLLLTAYIDRNTFGAGRMVTEQFSESVHAPLISMADDIYAHQSSLAQLLCIMDEIGSLQGKRIAVSWGFGSTFDLPNVAHSTVLFGTILGANMRIVSPKQFPLLNRVIKKARNLRDNSDASIEVIHEFKGSFDDVDAVIALNWCHLEHFNHPVRNAEAAAAYRDWFFTEEILQKKCLFSTQPPAQTNLIADNRLLESRRNLTRIWWKSRIAVLGASIAAVTQKHDPEYPLSFI